MTEDEMVGWHHRLNGHEFERIPGESEGPGVDDAVQPSHPLSPPSPLALNLSQRHGLSQ